VDSHLQQTLPFFMTLAYLRPFPTQLGFFLGSFAIFTKRERQEKGLRQNFSEFLPAAFT